MGQDICYCVEVISQKFILYLIAIEMFPFPIALTQGLYQKYAIFSHTHLTQGLGTVCCANISVGTWQTLASNFL